MIGKLHEMKNDEITSINNIIHLGLIYRRKIDRQHQCNWNFQLKSIYSCLVKYILMRNNFSKSCFGIDKGRTCNKGRHVPWFYLLFYHFMIKKKKKLDFLASVSQVLLQKWRLTTWPKFLGMVPCFPILFSKVKISIIFKFCLICSFQNL